MSGSVVSSSSHMRAFSSLTFHTRRSGIRLKRFAWLMALAPEQIDDPHQQRQDDAHNYASHDRKIKTTVAALDDDIARQTAQAERQLRTGHQKRSGCSQDNAGDEQEFAEIAD